MEIKKNKDSIFLDAQNSRNRNFDIIFKDGIIQKGERIKIPKAIVDTLNLKEGKEVLIKFDAASARMIIEFDNSKKGGKNAK